MGYKPWDERHLNAEKMPSTGSKLSVTECVDLALDVSLLGLGQVSPNPLVGTVAVDKDHCFIAMGAHEKYGEAHAEVNLLNKIKKEGLEKKLEGATLYVTLEPCSHQGKTPSCALELIRYPIKKVVYGLKDPNLKVNGKGLSILEKHNIIYELNQRMAVGAQYLLSPFIHAQSSKNPFIAAKVASSLNGVIAKEESVNFPITGSRAKEYGHWLRAFYDGIVIGSRTLILDNPRLNVRHSKLDLRSPQKVVWDLSGKALFYYKDRSLKLMEDKSKIYWVMDKSVLKSLESSFRKEWESKGVDFIALNESDRDFTQVLGVLKGAGIYSLLLEGGAGLWGQFLSRKLVSKIHFFQSNAVFSGENFLHWNEYITKECNMKLVGTDVTLLGNDVLLESEINY